MNLFTVFGINHRKKTIRNCIGHCQGRNLNSEKDKLWNTIELNWISLLVFISKAYCWFQQNLFPWLELCLYGYSWWMSLGMHSGLKKFTYIWKIQKHVCYSWCVFSNKAKFFKYIISLWNRNKNINVCFKFLVFFLDMWPLAICDQVYFCILSECTLYQKSAE